MFFFPLQLKEKCPFAPTIGLISSRKSQEGPKYHLRGYFWYIESFTDGGDQRECPRAGQPIHLCNGWKSKDLCGRNSPGGDRGWIWFCVCGYDWIKALRHSVFFFFCWTKWYTGAFAAVGKSTSKSERSHYPQWNICKGLWKNYIFINLPVYLVFSIFPPLLSWFCRTQYIQLKKTTQSWFEVCFSDVFPYGFILDNKKAQIMPCI